MNMQTEEVIGSMHLWLTKQIASATKARNKTSPKKPQQKAMLAGKVKAYVDMISHIEGKWGAKLVHLPLPKK